MPMKPDKSRAVLLVVDIQPDFLPGGALSVQDADQILDGVAALMRSDRFGLCVATQDWHPPKHVSFASQHGRKPFEHIMLYGHSHTLWPDHCVQGTPGAALHPALPWEKAEAIIRKGADPRADSYSGFRNNWNAQGQRPPTGLGGYLKERGIGQVFACGLARDVCVKWTAEDAAAAGFETAVLWDLTRPVDPSTDETVRTSLEAAGVHVVQSQEL